MKKRKKPTSEISNKISAVLKKNNLTHNKLASILKVSQPCVGWWLKGNVKNEKKFKEKYFSILKKKGYI